MKPFEQTIQTLTDVPEPVRAEALAYYAHLKGLGFPDPGYEVRDTGDDAQLDLVWPADAVGNLNADGLRLVFTPADTDVIYESGEYYLAEGMPPGRAPALSAVVREVTSQKAVVLEAVKPTVL